MPIKASRQTTAWLETRCTTIVPTLRLSTAGFEPKAQSRDLFVRESIRRRNPVFFSSRDKSHLPRGDPGGQRDGLTYICEGSECQHPADNAGRSKYCQVSQILRPGTRSNLLEAIESQSSPHPTLQPSSTTNLTGLTSPSPTARTSNH